MEEQHNNHETHEDKLTKATSSSLSIKMIAKPEWTQSNAQQNIEQLQNPTEQPIFHCLLRLVLCATVIVYHVIYKYRQIFPTEEFSCRKVKYICRY